jgi:hypothetical protein
MIARLWTSYLSLLQARPVPTNMATAGVVGACGDVLAQCIESESEGSINTGRVLKVASWQVLTAGPLTYWFRFLDRTWPITAGASSFSNLLVVWKKVGTNQITAAPCNNFGFYSYCIAFKHTMAPDDQAQSISTDITQKLYKDGVSTTLNSCLVWGPAWTVNFLFLPPHTRVLFNSVGQLFWVAYLSSMGHKRDL